MDDWQLCGGLASQLMPLVQQTFALINFPPFGSMENGGGEDGEIGGRDQNKFNTVSGTDAAPIQRQIIKFQLLWQILGCFWLIFISTHLSWLVLE